MPQNTIEIPLNKTKLKRILVLAALFVAAGIWFIVAPPVSETGIFQNRIVFTVLGIITVVFFSISILMMYRKIKDEKPALIIDSKGITDNASGVSAGFIPWTDIKDIKETEVVNQKFLMLIVHNPQEYIERQTNALKRSSMKLNYKQSGSPISIPAQAIQMNFRELMELVRSHFEKSRN